MQIEGLFAGKPQAFGPRKKPSSIIKQPFTSLKVNENGAEEDEQGNKKLHGGPHMALHQYSQLSYDILRDHFPAIADQLVPGSIGENITAPNMTDDNVFIGDMYAIGDVIVEVASPRAPCVKINQRFNQAGMDIFIASNGICGWYYRILRKGTLEVGQEIKLIERLDNTVSVRELMVISRSKSQQARIDASKISALPPEWVSKLTKALK